MRKSGLAKASLCCFYTSFITSSYLPLKLSTVTPLTKHSKWAVVKNMTIQAKPIRMSRQTRTNWLIDTAVFLGAVSAIFSGIYFLVLPNGYEGGRNPWYGVVLLFSRQTWDSIHLWGGVLMILAVVIHFAIHWSWVKLMARRLRRAVTCREDCFSRGAKINVAVDVVIALSFLVTAVSGLYFLFAPGGSYQGGRNPNWDPGWLFSRTTWDVIHTWGAVVLIIAAMLHFFIHWRWIANVTRRFFLSLKPQPTAA